MSELPAHSTADAEIELHREAARIAAEWEHAGTSAAVRTIWGPALIGLAYISSTSSVSLSEDWPSIAIAAMTSLYLSIIVGCVIGSVAYFITKSRGRVAVVRVAIAMALIFDFTLWGWTALLSSLIWWN